MYKNEDIPVKFLFVEYEENCSKAHRLDKRERGGNNSIGVAAKFLPLENFTVLKTVPNGLADTTKVLQNGRRAIWVVSAGPKSSDLCSSLRFFKDVAVVVYNFVLI